MGRPTVGSLFSGIGGLDLGLERAGFETRWFCEADPYCRQVLARHWPDQPCYPDVRTVDWSAVEPVDLVCGGFPCQPVSLAGKRKGEDDARWLWPEFARCLRDLRPRLALLENVPGLLTQGFGAVLGDLAEIGFDAEWQVLSAYAVGAPHLRERIYIVAWDSQRISDAEGVGFEARRLPGRAGAEITKPSGGCLHGLAHADRAWELQPCGGLGEGGRRTGDRRRQGLPNPSRRIERQLRWLERPPQGEGFGDIYWPQAEPPVCGVVDGVPHRVDRLRALGNAVVPACAEYLGRLILERFLP